MTPERKLLVKLGKKLGEFTRRVSNDELFDLANDLEPSLHCKCSLLIYFCTAIFITGIHSTTARSFSYQGRAAV
jgi:hypothetical protein